MNIQGRGGDRAHEATTVLVARRFPRRRRSRHVPRADPRRAAALAAEEAVLRGRLRRRRTRRAADAAGASAASGEAHAGEHRGVRPAAGPHYAEIGSDARGSHKCQGMGGLGMLPGMAGGRARRTRRAAGGYQLMDTTIPGQMAKDETSLFDGVDTSLAAVAQFAGPNPPEALTAGLAAIVDDAKRAQSAFDAGNDAGTAAPDRSRSRQRCGRCARNSARWG